MWIQANKAPAIYYVAHYLSPPLEDCFMQVPQESFYMRSIIFLNF